MRQLRDHEHARRLTMAGAAADARYSEVVRLRFAGRREAEVAADLARLLRDFGRRLNNTDHRLKVVD